ncbi:MAG TPA: DUF6587 family protein [Stenotrophomonas sp.]|jgi:hypothetical protein
MAIWLQYVVIALAVVTSALVVWKKQFPGSWRRARTAGALPLLRNRRPAAQRLGRWLAPPMDTAGNSCNGCNGCDTGASKH